MKQDDFAYWSEDEAKEFLGYNETSMRNLKSIKSKFVKDLVDKIEYKGNPYFEQTYKANQTYIFVTAFNNLIKKSKIKVVKNKLYGAIINYMASLNRTNDSITIASIVKHFENTDTPINKQVLLDMVKDRLLYKSYHKVCIGKKGFEYLK